MLKRYSEIDGRLQEDPDGRFVDIEDASRHFQWHAFDRILNWINTKERMHFCRKYLQREMIEMRPQPIDKDKD
jgi:hypothetical protein